MMFASIGIVLLIIGFAIDEIIADDNDYLILIIIGSLFKSIGGLSLLWSILILARTYLP